MLNRAEVRGDKCPGSFSAISIWKKLSATRLSSQYSWGWIWKCLRLNITHSWKEHLHLSHKESFQSWRYSGKLTHKHGHQRLQRKKNPVGSAREVISLSNPAMFNLTKPSMQNIIRFFLSSWAGEGVQPCLTRRCPAGSRLLTSGRPKARGKEESFSQPQSPQRTPVGCSRRGPQPQDEASGYSWLAGEPPQHLRDAERLWGC